MSTAFDELYTPIDRNFETALVALNSLQSNAITIASWIASRRADPYVDLHEEMLFHVNAAGINLPSLSVIHVAGTKGKGSTCAFVDSILRASGHRTGLYTSPHLIDVRERIRVDGKVLSKVDFSAQFWSLWDKLAAARSEKFPKMPAFFRFLTLLALQVFEESKLDACILEVGIGGRADATNVVDVPVVTGISSLGFDHMNVLGNTLPEIALEKAGIMKRGVPAFTVPQLPEAMQVIEERARVVGAPLCIAPPFESHYPRDNVTLGLKGDHQRSNAALAIALSQVWLTTSLNSKSKPTNSTYTPTSNNYQPDTALPQYFSDGLAACRWAGRAQTFKLPSHENLHFFVDGAHTPESTEVCAKWFETTLQENNNLTTNTLNLLVFHCGKGRSAPTLLTPIATHILSQKQFHFDKAVFPTFNIFSTPVGTTLTKAFQSDNDPEWRAQIAETWQQLSGMKPTDCEQLTSVAEAVDFIKKLAAQVAPSTRVNVLVTGSLYLVGAVLQVCEVDV